MSDNNSVHLIGVIKRNATAGDSGTNRVLDFAVEVTNRQGRRDIFDCRLTNESDAYEELEGFVNEGEPIEIIGHLEKITRTEGKRVGSVWVEVRNTSTFVYVDEVVVED